MIKHSTLPSGCGPWGWLGRGGVVSTAPPTRGSEWTARGRGQETSCFRGLVQHSLSGWDACHSCPTHQGQVRETLTRSARPPPAPPPQCGVGVEVRVRVVHTGERSGAEVTESQCSVPGAPSSTLALRVVCVWGTAQGEGRWQSWGGGWAARFVRLVLALPAEGGAEDVSGASRGGTWRWGWGGGFLSSCCGFPERLSQATWEGGWDSGGRQGPRRSLGLAGPGPISRKPKQRVGKCPERLGPLLSPQRHAPLQP